MAQKRTPWVERAAAIKEQFPMSVTIDWNAVFIEDPVILGNLVNDILKLDQSRAGKPGKRPSLAEASTADKLRKIQDADYSENFFTLAFKNLCGDRSVRAVASKTGLDKSYVHRLMSGTTQPNTESLETIAVAFGKHPSYFLEHRVNYILNALEEKLTKEPETSIVLYNKLTGRSEKL